MKISLILAALVLSASALAARMNTPSMVAPSMVEDPPEPANCPLCGGDASLHSRTVLAIEDVQANILVYALRW